MKNNSNEQYTLKDQLKAFIEANNLSLRKIASSLGVKGYSTSVISQYLNGKYEGDVTTLNSEVENFLEREKEKSTFQRREIPFSQTGAALTIISTCRQCHKEGDLGIIVGYPGVGKTTAIREYARKYNDAILIEVNSSFTTKSTIKFIAKKIGLHPDAMMTSDVFPEIIEKLLDTGKLLIIDEAEHLSIKALDLIRSIHDQAHIGVILIGHPKFVYNLKNKKSDYSYIYDRAGKKDMVAELSIEDVEKLVHAFFPSANGLWKEFHTACGHNARKLTKLLQRCDSITSLQKKPLTKQVIELAKEMITL